MNNINFSHEEAMQKYLQMPLPKENEEPWRYTDLSTISLPERIGQNIQIKIDGDSQFVKSITKMQNDVQSTSVHSDNLFHFSKLFIPKDKIDFLHAASWKDGFVIHVPKNTSANIKINTASDTSSHNIIIVEENTQLKLFYDYNCSGLSTDVTEIFAGESASIEFISTRESEQAFNFSSFICDLQRNAKIRWIIAAVGDKLTRIKVNTIFSGEGAESESTDMFVGRGSGHIDITTNAHHKVPKTISNMYSRGVLYDSSSSIYRGLIKIEKEAQKTSSYLHGKNLKMSPDTTANSIPSLKIDANDVQAGHGDTTSKVDENQVYYLMSRGLSKEQAEQMIVDGFFVPLLSKVPEEFKTAVEGILNNR